MKKLRKIINAELQKTFSAARFHFGLHFTLRAQLQAGNPFHFYSASRLFDFMLSVALTSACQEIIMAHASARDDYLPAVVGSVWFRTVSVCSYSIRV